MPLLYIVPKVQITYNKKYFSSTKKNVTLRSSVSLRPTVRTYDSKFLLLICTFNKENIAVKKQKTRNCKTNVKLRYAQGPKLAY